MAKAQRESLITVGLISPKTESSYYQREETAAAIDLSRHHNYVHRVVPIYLHYADIPIDVPYGLRRLHGIYMSQDILISGVVRKLQELLVDKTPAEEFHEENSRSQEELLTESVRKPKTKDQFELSSRAALLVQPDPDPKKSEQLRALLVSLAADSASANLILAEEFPFGLYRHKDWEVRVTSSGRQVVTPSTSRAKGKIALNFGVSGRKLSAVVFSQLAKVVTHRR